MTAHDAKLCPHCGAKMVEYKHGLSKGILRGLYKLAARGGGPVNLNDLGLTYNQQSNFQKLRYWGLVEKVDPLSEKGGDWKITASGIAFMKCEQAQPKYAWSYRGDAVRHSTETVMFDEVTEGYKYRPEWARESVPVGDTD